MRLLSTLLGIGLCSGSLLVAPSGAIAQTAVLSVGQQTAQGTHETGIYTIRLGTSQGVNLSFLAVNETIQRVWLNDPSRVVLDFDGCLPGALVGGQRQSCEGTAGASIVHIRQLQQRIDFPAQVVSGTGRQTLMTIVTVGVGGDRKIYQFRLVFQSGTPPHSLVQVVPAVAITSNQINQVSPQYQQAILDQLSRGLAYAEANQLVQVNSDQHRRLKYLVTLMQQGTPYSAAIQQAQVPGTVVDRIRGYSQRAGN